MIVTQSDCLIRLMREDELDVVLPLLRAFHKIASPEEPFRDERALQAWRAILGSHAAFLLGAWQTHHLVGILGMTVRQAIYNEIVCANEIVWYVLPEHRQTAAGLKLIDYAEREAHGRGATQIVLGHFMDEDSRRLELLYRRRGYQAFGVGYRKEMNHV